MKKIIQRYFKFSFIISILILLVVATFGKIIRTKGQAQYEYAQAVVLVNSTSASYPDFMHLIQPYLDHFGIPYTTIDLSTTALPADLGSYSLIIIGHKELDIQNTYLDEQSQQLIISAVNQGTGLVNFDSVLSDENLHPYYQYVQDIYGFGYTIPDSASDVNIISSPEIGAYVVAQQSTNAVFALYGEITPEGVTLAPQNRNLATLGGQPFLVATTYGQGKAIQWTTYEWLQSSIWGYMRGFDDLIWRGFVWSARKPFALQGFPPLVTMRVDDVAGPLQWAYTATSVGYKPWLGIFLHEIDTSEATDISALVNSGNATASVHSFTDENFFYWNQTDSQIEANYAEASIWHQVHGIPISKLVVPHYYQYGSNIFPGLNDWGVEFFGTVLEAGKKYGSQWIMLGPYRNYETGYSRSLNPVVYGDYIPFPEHPEFNDRFFDCLSEPRGKIYDWILIDSVRSNVRRGTENVKRGLNSMVISSLFTHEYYINSIDDSIWQSTLEGIANNISAYNPIYTTIDYACQYQRAVYSSEIISSMFDPSTQMIETTLIGATDLPTSFYLFTEEAGFIQRTLVDVPSFNGATTVYYSLLTPTPTATSTPGPSPTLTNTPTATATSISTSTATQTDTPQPSFTPSITSTPTNTSLPTNTPTSTSTQENTTTPTATLTPTGTPTPSETSTPTITPTSTDTQEPQPTPESIQINLWEDIHQDPILPTTSRISNLIDDDDQWTEFLWVKREYPGVFAAYTERPPLMRFYGTVPNGTYTLIANLYWSKNLRYYWGYSENNPEEYAFDVTSGNSGDFAEYTLGTISVTNGVFDLYTYRADPLPGGNNYPFYGWAWIRLIP